jgi:tetratricopeptide (TPR) repeat protein
MTFMNKRIAFEKEVSSTPLGRRSFSLRERAHDLVRAGREADAFKLYEEAASLHADDDPSPAAAMCWYDLAETYRRRQDGVRVANLSAAEGLLRRTLRSPALERDPHRAAKTRDALASCLRHLAEELLYRPRADTLLAEATQLFEQAVTITEHGGPVARESLAGYLHNLGNLEGQRGRFDKADLRMSQAEGFARGIEYAEEPGGRDKLLSAILVHGARYRARRGRPGDREAALQKLAEALRIGHPAWVHRAELGRAEVMLDDPGAPREQVVAALGAVRSDELPPHALGTLIDLYRRAGLRREALLFLHGNIRRAVEARRETMADHTGAFWAAQAQLAAHLAARLHVEGGEAIEAFLTLEDVSGMRFDEVVSVYSNRLESVVARAVQRHFHRIGTAATMMEHHADLLALAEAPAEAARALRDNLQANVIAAEARAFDHGGLDVHGPLTEALAEAERQADPVGFLRGRAQQARQDALRIHRRLVRLDPTADPLGKPWTYRPTPELVRELLRETPGHAIVRLSLADDLLVIALWLEGDELVARAHRVEVPPLLFTHLAMHQHRPEDAPPGEIAAALALLDLSPALPSSPMKHAILLPSYAASFLPLGALGPTGQTLLDRFRALSWMPSLAPLVERQSPHPPRSGVVSVAPGGTKHHGIALRTALPGEVRLEGAEATVERVAEVARHADVLCFYTHGRHAGEHGPEVALTGSKLDRSWLDQRWAGMERVELWACQSGVNLPNDPLTPPVDEIFGMDNELLHVGVRSAIGTLWKVPDLVTACLVHHYRRRLIEGALAPVALADAQRWWRDEGACALVDELRRLPPVEALRAFVQKLGATLTEDAPDVGALLGPALPDGAGPDMIDRTLARLRSPVSWAGFRFVGVAERRPSRPWSTDDERALTPSEDAEVEAILAEARAEAPAQALDDWQEKRLAESTALPPGGHPSAEQAIRVARQYRDRVSSSHRHNLLAALAWLHEARATLTETASDVEAQSQERDRLVLEAAWLWMELGRGEVVHGYGLLLTRPSPVAITRARRLLEEAPESPHARVLHAWVALLAADPGSIEELHAALRGAWAQVEPAVEATLTRSEDYEGLRTLTEAGELLLLAPDVLKEQAAAFVARALPRGSTKSWPYDLVGCGMRLRSALALLQRHLGADDALPMAGPGLLAPGELARETAELAREMYSAPPSEGLDLHRKANNCFDALEGALWGWPDDDRMPLWQSTGTLGAGYRRLAGLWLGSLGRGVGGEEGMATQIIACLQPAADLRLTLLSRWVHLFAVEDHPSYRFWVDARDRETLLETLEDAALLPDFQHAVAAETPAPLEPHHLDPFRCSGDELQRGAASPLDLVPWVLGEYTKHTPTDGAAAVTSAFRAVGESVRCGTIVADIWKTLLHAAEEARATDAEPGAPEPAALFDPLLRVPDRETWLRHMPTSLVVLGLAISPGGELIAASVWNTGDATEQRVHVTQGPTGARVRHLLADLHQPEATDETTARGASSRRRELWDELQRAIEPALQPVLGPALERGPLSVAVLAPGSLRPLPLLGLHVGGRPLYERSLGVMLLPSLGAEPGRHGATSEACLLGRERDEGDTSFGEAAVETLRRWFEPRVIRPPREATTTIVEVDQLEPIAPTLRALRLYGVGNVETMAPTLASMNLEGRRKFSDRNTRGLLLRRCEVVELWAATAGSGPESGIRRDDRDRIPGLVRSFLLCGAAGVVDLAWPVPDLVKALVCERLGVLSRAGSLRGPEALGRAVAETAEFLRAWRSAAIGAATMGEALDWLDGARRAAAREAKLPEKDLIPLVARADAPSVVGRSVVEVIEEACAPVHLAAFRFWGWFQR